MTSLEFAGVLAAGLILAGSAAFLWYELRVAPLIDEVPGRAALDHARRTVPAQAPSPSNEDCEDALMADVMTPDALDALINATREDPVQQFIPGVPCDAEINVWMDRWTAEQQEER